jgi:hypothetical protein
MLLNKVKDLILALNLQGLNIVLSSETKYSRKYKSLYNSYRITVWEKYIENHKTKHKPIYNKKMKLSDILLMLADAIKQDNKKEHFKTIGKEEYYAEKKKRDRDDDR